MSSSGRIRRYPSVGTSSIGHHGPRGEEPPWEMAIYGDLTDKQPELIGQLLDVPPNSRGTIFFDSCGGSAYTGLGLASLIQLRGLHAVGVVASECSSAALLPFAACKERYVTAHSTLLFHPIRWSSDDDIRMEEAAEWARHFQLLEKDLDVLLSRMFDIDEKQLSEWTHPGRFVSGRELVQAGLAKEIDLFSGTVWEQIEKMGD